MLMFQSIDCPILKASDSLIAASPVLNRLMFAVGKPQLLLVTLPTIVYPFVELSFTKDRQDSLILTDN